MIGIIINFLKWLFGMNKKNTGKRIKIDDLRSGKVSLGAMIEYVRENVDQNALFADNLHDVAKAGLSLFELPELKSKQAIESAARQITEIFYPLDTENPVAYVKKFNENILDIEGLPATLRSQFATPAIAELAQLDDLLAYYENESEIASVIRNAETPRYHKGYWLKAFYERTLKKRDQIVAYLDNHIKSIVLRFSRPGYRENWYGQSGASEGLMELREKYPYRDIVIENYKLALAVDMERLDWRKVNPVRNKVFVHTFQADYAHGYTDDINQEILNGINADDLLDKINEKLKNFPLIKKRKDIFDELKLLFQHRHWYGFYALAIPQVEGIFSEISLLINEKNKTSGSLPDKVSLVRPASEVNDLHFDYYEYYLPEDRNKFSHTGKDTQIELRSRYMLLDLANLMEICEQQNAPLIHLSNMIADGPENFVSINSLAQLIRLVDETKKLKAYPEVESDLLNLLHNELPLVFDLAGYVGSIQGEYEQALKLLNNWIEWGFYRSNEPEGNLSTMSPYDVYKHRELIQKTYNESGTIFNESLRFLLDVHEVIINLPRLFPAMNSDILAAIDSFIAANKQTLVNLAKLIRTIDFGDIQDDFLIDKVSRTAQWNAFSKSSADSATAAASPA